MSHIYENNPGCVITKHQFSPLFYEAWYKEAREENLIDGFKKAGVCPFNSNAIKAPVLTFTEHNQSTGDVGPSSCAIQGDLGATLENDKEAHSFSID